MEILPLAVLIRLRVVVNPDDLLVELDPAAHLQFGRWPGADVPHPGFLEEVAGPPVGTRPLTSPPLLTCFLDRHLIPLHESPHYSQPATSEVASTNADHGRKEEVHQPHRYGDALRLLKQQVLLLLKGFAKLSLRALVLLLLRLDKS